MQAHVACKNERRVSRAMHIVCCLIQEVSWICSVALPYPLVLKPAGFFIAASNDRSFPLFLKIESEDAREKCKHQILFENGVVLLDKNVKFLAHVHRQSGDLPFLGIKALQGSIRWLAMEPAVNVKAPKRTEAEFEVLSIMQHKLLAIIDELEKLRMPERATDGANSSQARSGYLQGFRRMFGY